MSNEQACATPLVDMLRSVPASHRTEWETQWAEDGTPTGHAMSPIGKHCHDAADRIADLEAELATITKLYNTNTGAVVKLRKTEKALERVLDTEIDWHDGPLTVRDLGAVIKTLAAIKGDKS